MLRKKNIDEKTKPFTSVIINIPCKISICGDKATEEEWKDFFKDKKNSEISKSKFFWRNFKKDLGRENFDNFINSDFLTNFLDTYKKESLNALSELKKPLLMPSLSEYYLFIVGRNKEKNKNKKEDDKKQ
ncbi:hypothetical protein CL617_04855 [archaeon]|nr:hypothetical protein [archaeon]|tara:strand:- start:6704 stop:7093 length:390 start_codon:yes stop_codon:yes gene_type:complete